MGEVAIAASTLRSHPQAAPIPEARGVPAQIFYDGEQLPDGFPPPPRLCCQLARWFTSVTTLAPRTPRGTPEAWPDPGRPHPSAPRERSPPDAHGPHGAACRHPAPKRIDGPHPRRIPSTRPRRSGDKALPKTPLSDPGPPSLLPPPTGLETAPTAVSWTEAAANMSVRTHEVSTGRGANAARCFFIATRALGAAEPPPCGPRSVPPRVLPTPQPRRSAGLVFFSLRSEQWTHYLPQGKLSGCMATGQLKSGPDHCLVVVPPHPPGGG